jgi:hypothetical protein
MYWHPWQFGQLCPSGPHPEAPDLFPEQDRYNKKTCIWTGNGFTLPTYAPVEKPHSVFVGHIKLGGKSARTKHLRSLTPRGFAKAVFLANKHLFCEEIPELVVDKQFLMSIMA